MKHPIYGISGSKPRLRQILAEEAAEKRKGASTQRKKRKRKIAKAAG